MSLTKYLRAAWKNKWIKDNVLRPIFDEYIESYIASLTGYQSIIHDLLMFRSSKKFTFRNMKRIFEKYGKSKEQIAEEIKELVFECSDQVENWGKKIKPEFYAWYADYDWVVFCWLYGRMIDLPRGFPMYCRDLKQMLDDKKKSGNLPKVVFGSRTGDLANLFVDFRQHPDYPEQENEHNALDDARWNKKLFNFLNTI